MLLRSDQRALARLVVLTAAAVALAGCGGSTKTVIIETQTVTVPGSTTPTATTTSTATTSGPSGSGLVYFYGDVGVAANPLVRPVTITFAADGNHTVTGLQWHGWGTSAVDATGTDHVNDCKPNCAQGHIQAIPATVNLYRPGLHFGRRMYLCYRVAFTVNSPVPGFGYCISADTPTPAQPQNTKCGRNTTFCPVEVDCPTAAGGGPSPHGCYGVVGVSGNTARPTPGPDKTGLGLDCSWSQPALNADRTVYVYICDPGP